AVFNLATTHGATTGNTAAAWTDNVTLPTWSSQADGAYTVRATATDKAGNSFTGTAVSFTLDKTAPATASVTTPTGGSSFRAGTTALQTTATDTAGNSITGTAVSFQQDSTAPATASVTTPAGGSSFRPATVPASFSGSVADNAGGVGLAANSTTFTLKRSTDN